MEEMTFGEFAWISWAILLAIPIIIILGIKREEIADFFSDLYKKLFHSGKNELLEQTLREEYRDYCREVVNVVDRNPNTTSENRWMMRFIAINSAYKKNTNQDADFQAISKCKKFSFIKDIAKQERQNTLRKYCGIQTEREEQMLYGVALKEIVKLHKENTTSKDAYLIVFGADWCSHSKVFKERLDNAGISQFTYIDVDEDSSLLIKYGITLVSKENL